MLNPNEWTYSREASCILERFSPIIAKRAQSTVTTPKRISLSLCKEPSRNIIFLSYPMSKVNPAFLYPPSPQKSLKHRRANQIFKALTPSDTQTCECCSRRIAASDASASCCLNPDQLSFLGPGIPLFFLYLRMTILLLLAMAVLFSAFAIFSNLTTNDCASLQVCSGNIMNLMSLINKRSSELYFSLQGYFQLGFIIVVVIFFQGMRLAGRKLERQCDQVINSPSDYAVILRRLPKGAEETDINEMLQQRRKTLTPQELKATDNLKVVKVILSYSLKEYLAVNQQNTENFKQAIAKKQHQKFTPLPQPQPTKTSSIAVIIFQHQASKDLLIHKPSLPQRILQALCTPCVPIGEMMVKGEQIGVERAPEPDDICWENSGITMGGGILRKVLYGSVALLVLVIGGGTQYGLQLLYNSTSDSTLQTFLSILNSIVILVFNSIIMLTLILTTKKERNQTLTEYQSVLMTKQTIFQFFNAGIFVIGSEIAAKSDRFSLNDGICMQISTVMLSNCFVPSATLFLLTYTEIVNKLQAWLGESGCMEMTQEELNELYLGPAIDLPSKYAYILKIIWLTGLYAPLVPIVSVVAVLGLGLNYLIQKLLFAKSYSLPNTVSSQTYENAMELLQYFIITFAIGQVVVYLYFYSYKIDQVPLATLITIFLSLAIGAVNLVLPMGAINSALFPLPESTKSQVRYSAIEEKFEVTYEMINPAYKTDRERRNVKDVLGLRAEGKEKETGMAVAMEMTNLFMGSVGESRQPLLNSGMGTGGQNGQNGLNGQAPQGKPINPQTQQGPLSRGNPDSIFGAILKSNSANNNPQNRPNTSNGPNGPNAGNNGGNTDNLQGFNSLLDDLSSTKKQEGTPPPIAKQSTENTMMMPSNNLNPKDPRQQLRSIKKQIAPSSGLQNQPYNPASSPNPTPTPLNPQGNNNYYNNPQIANPMGHPSLNPNPNPNANQPIRNNTLNQPPNNQNPNNSMPNPHQNQPMANIQMTNPNPNQTPPMSNNQTPNHNNPNPPQNISHPNQNPSIHPPPASTPNPNNLTNSPNPTNHVSNPQQQTPPPSIPADNKSSLPSASITNDSFFKRTITPSQPNNKNSLNESSFEILQGEDGSKINVSVIQPPQGQARPQKKSSPQNGRVPPLALDNTNNHQDPRLPMNTNNTNSSTKYKKPPAGFSRQKEFPRILQEQLEETPTPQQQNISALAKNPQKQENPGLPFQPLKEEPSQEPRKAEIDKQQQPQARKEQLQQKQAQKNVPTPPMQNKSFEDAPLGISRPMVPLTPSPETIPKENGVYKPLPPCEQFKFQDPTKEKQSLYVPHLINHEDTPQKVSQRSYLNSEGIMKALGRPFSSFVSKMSVEGMTERSGKNAPNQGKTPQN